MNDTKKNELYCRAIDHYGAKEQMLQFNEELCECAAAVVRYANRCRDWLAPVAEEMADVEIMFEQMVILFQEDGLREEIDRVKDRKLERLEMRLDEAKQ